MIRLFLMGMRNVGRNQRRTLTTLAVITIGLAVVVFVRGFAGGWVKVMEESVAHGQTGALEVHRQGYVDNEEVSPTWLNMPEKPELEQEIASVPGVSGVAPRLIFSGWVSNGRVSTMFVGRGIDPVKEKAACPKAGFDLVSGTPLRPTDRDVVLLGKELGQAMGLDGAGEKSVVSLAGTSPTGRANTIDVAVQGMTESGFTFDNHKVLRVPLGLAQDLLGMQGKVTEYAVAVNDLAQVDQIAASLQKKLGPAYEVHTWRQLQPFVQGVIMRYKVVLSIITTVLLILVVIAITNAMLMTTFERMPEIGTFLAIGARPFQIVGIFLFEALTLGLLGGLFGAGIGRSLVALVAYKGVKLPIAGTSQVELLRPAVNPSFLLFVVCVGVVCASVAALLPALRASRASPSGVMHS